MALVDYSSSDSDTDREPPPSKRRKASDDRVAHSSDVTPGNGPGNDSDSGAQSNEAAGGVSDLPPLPLEFHDLYASTVRQSVVDDPSLHQGRRRQTPHVVGNWPSHLYVEWHPTNKQHAVLSSLITDVQARLSQAKLHDFLTSDLGAPLPLHISLSRPLSLPTADKDTFLEKITQKVYAPAISAFSVCPQGLSWFKSPDSNRTFLVLNVASRPVEAGKDGARGPNPELLSLLTRCNSTAEAFGQPILYTKNQTGSAGNAFHVSIGWTFDHPNDGAAMETVQLFDQAKFSEIRNWEIDVAGVKAKIGNVVNHIALDGSGRRGARSRLFGL